MRKNNLIGQRFNRLTVVAEAGRNKKMNVLWKCACDCGGAAIAPAYDLRRGRVKSCGCLAREGLNVKHGHARGGSKRNPTYSLWAAMVQRCTNPNDRNWVNYGGRGITIANRWMSFENFYADMGDKPEGLSLERLDNGKGYCKSNCAWATKTAQARNKRTNIWVKVGGVEALLADWIRVAGLTNNGVHYRVKHKGETHAQAIEYFIKKKGLSWPQLKKDL